MFESKRMGEEQEKSIFAGERTGKRRKKWHASDTKWHENVRKMENPLTFWKVFEIITRDKKAKTKTVECRGTPQRAGGAESRCK